MSSEPAVATACSNVGQNYRFLIPMSTAFVQGFKGQPLHIYGISPTGKNNDEIGNSGFFKVP